MSEGAIHIIGAGPAGCLSSLHLSSLGIPHRLIEAGRHPRDKACADILTSNAIRELDRIVPDLLPSLLAANEAQAIWGTHLRLGAERQADIPYHGLDGKTDQPSCYAMRRDLLDHALWQAATQSPHCHASQGLRLTEALRQEDGWTLRFDNEMEEVSALLLMATGSGAGPAGLRLDAAPEHVALGIRAYVLGVKDLNPNRCELFLEEKLMPGGFYLAPLPNGLCNVNVVVRKDKVQRDGMNLNTMLNELIANHPVLAPRFRDVEIQGSVQGSPLLLATQQHAMVDERLLRIGDAAGLIDLISANGIPQALLSGRIAAQVVAEARHQGDFSTKALAGYEIKVQAAIRSEVRLGRVLSPFLGYPLLCRWTLKGMRAIIGDDSEGGVLQDMLYSDRPLRTLLKSAIPTSTS